MGSTYRLRNLKTNSRCYQIVMPQRYYENQIKNKIKIELKSRVEEAKEVYQARAKASKLAEATNDKGSLLDQMVRPPLQFVGTEVEQEYLAREALAAQTNIEEIAPPARKYEAPPDGEGRAVMLRRMLDKEKKSNKKEYAASMDLTNNYSFPQYRLWD